jgi:acetyl-CoA C-acetyltransferase
MVLDPRTPVIVGVGQMTNRPDPEVALADRPEPLDLMVSAARAAAHDAAGGPAGPAPVGDRLLARADAVAVVASLGWHPPNPALAVAERLGANPPCLLQSTTGGNTPQSLVNHFASAIARGEHEVVLVTGAECLYTRTAALRRPDHPALRWQTQPPDTPPAQLFGTDRAPATDLEVARGVQLPIHAYPLMENALRAARGWSLDEHRQRIGSLWSAFSDVAAANPHAWLRRHYSADELMTPGEGNRMVAFPYPKLCTANLQVDQGAAFLLCSVDAARAAGLPEDRWVFPLAGTDACDHWFLSHRPELERSPAIELAGKRAFELAGVGTDDLAAVDLYSCFPVVVQMAAQALGLPVDDPARPLTLTGGLTFAGGPGNNYTTHGIAAMVERLRQLPGEIGLVTGLGWYATKHAVGLYASRPSASGRGFRSADVQEEVDVLPQCRLDAEAEGEVRLETYTVLYERDGTPAQGIAVCRTAEGNRAWGSLHQPDDLLELITSEGVGRTGRLATDGELTLT